MTIIHTLLDGTITFSPSNCIRLAILHVSRNLQLYGHNTNSVLASNLITNSQLYVLDIGMVGSTHFNLRIYCLPMNSYM